VKTARVGPSTTKGGTAGDATSADSSTESTGPASDAHAESSTADTRADTSGGRRGRRRRRAPERRDRDTPMAVVWKPAPERILAHGKLSGALDASFDVAMYDIDLY